MPYNKLKHKWTNQITHVSFVALSIEPHKKLKLAPTLPATCCCARMWRSPGKISDLSVCWNHWDNTHPLILWNREWLLGTPYTSKSHTVEQCHLSRQCTCPQRASWMYSWAPWEPSEVSEDCAGGYMNKFPNKTRQLWPTCELQNWNQVGSRVQIAPKWTPDRHAFTVGCVDVWVRFSWHNGLLATRILKNETDSFFSSPAVEPLGQKHLAR